MRSDDLRNSFQVRVDEHDSAKQLTSIVVPCPRLLASVRLAEHLLDQLSDLNQANS